MQYSGAESIIPISKEGILTPDEEPDVQGSGPQIPEPDVQGEPQVQGEEPKVDKDGEPEVQDGDDLTNRDDGTESEDQPEPTDPRKDVPGGLDVANVTQQELPPAFKIKITFDAIKPKYLLSGANCGEWDFGVYVQGKLTKLDDAGQPLKVCKNVIFQLKNAEVTVDIPGEKVESPKDYQPLSIFTAGSQLDNCDPNPLPADSAEVRKILSDKGSTRPYYADAEKNIRNIQGQINNGCTQKYWSNPFNCASWAGQTICAGGTYNGSLAKLNILEGSPGYGKVVSGNTVGNPSSIQFDTCSGVTNANFCLYYTLDCSLCPAVRVH